MKECRFSTSNNQNGTLRLVVPALSFGLAPIGGYAEGRGDTPPWLHERVERQWPRDSK
jgi:hypothetical protein